MLIKKEPVGTISVDKDGKITIHHISGKTEESCMYCGKLTKNRNLGLAECKDCFEFEYSVCKKCKFGVKRGNFVAGLTDLDDHFEYYIACMKRDNRNRRKLLKKPNPKSRVSAWHSTPLERKKCFQSKKEVKEENLKCPRCGKKLKYSKLALFSAVYYCKCGYMRDV